MRYKKEEIEIMAPVGSFDSLAAAIQSGANSVYFGIEQLNMRAKSSINFTTEDLKEIVRISSENNVRSYLVVNTIIYDYDLALMKQIVDTAKASGVSAVIAADQAVISYASSIGVEVHISTQVNISNVETVKFYSHFADVMVLARELSMKQIAHICSQIEEENITGPSGNLIEVEIFAHGALCMAISGKCYLSLHDQNSSANRGACLQNCRKSYTVTDNETGNQLEIDNEYIMSPKDLSTISFVDKIIEAGVKVLKIEGRARPAEYVHTVTTAYRAAVDATYDGTFSQEKADAWTKELETVFNRGFWGGYYMGRKSGEWSKNYGSAATKRKEYLGKVTNYFSKLGVGEFLMQAGSLKPGEEILITGPTTGVIKLNVEDIRYELETVDEATKGQAISFAVPDKIRRSDKLYKMVDNT